ncbi:CCAAT/enhancer-binding protein epsilon-like [Clavelina lepadiformis]|uniref:BZIP domain-containing protein n=1 Tax=Clavelina lepadiformis TaxID=159417 RepID=A0ABP0GWW6_CLALP
MAFDPNLNRGGACKIPMSNTSCTELSDLCQNDESLDFSQYISNSGNLELCSDELFQNIFSPESPSTKVVKGEELDQFDSEVESWYCASEPTSACASACSSAAPSPVPFNYYNTPPVTPQSDRYRSISPSTLQFDGLNNTMAGRFAPIREEDPSNNYVPVRQLPAEAAQLQEPVVIKQEPGIQQPMQPPPYSLHVKKEQNATLTSQQVVNIGSNEHSSNSLKQAAKRSATTHYKGPNKKSKSIVKGTEEYMLKRERNNVAVRRSRDKAKMKAIETQKKVEELSTENEQLHKRVAELSHELNTLKNLLKSLPHVSA